MAVQALNIIKEWFKRGKNPTESQFSDVWDSFFHKSERIPQSQILGLQETIESASKGLIYKDAVDTESELAVKYPDALTGWAAMVKDVGYIFSFNGDTWANTGLKAFPEDVAVKDDLTQIERNVNVINKQNNIPFIFNLFDPIDPDYLIGFYINDLGAEIADSRFNTTGYISVKAEQYIIWNNSARFCYFFDKNKKLIRILNNPETGAVQAPANSEFFRYCGLYTMFDKLMIEYGIISHAYTAGVIPNNDKWIDNYLSGEKIKQKTIVPNKTTFFKQSKNLLNPKTVTSGFFINWNNGNLQANASYDASDFIEVEAGKPYFLSNASVAYMAWYDSNKAFISGNQSGMYPLTSPVNAVYARFSINSKSAISTQVEQGEVATAFVPFKFEFDFEYSPQSWKNRKWCVIGDSITFQGLYINPVSELTGLAMINNISKGGKLLSGDGTADNPSMNSDYVINQIPSDIELITVMGGTNDWAQSIVLGGIDDDSNVTYKGALKILIEKISVRFPSARLILMTPPYGELPARIDQGWINSYTNNQGLTTIDYGSAMVEVARRYSIPVADVGAMTGFNKYNLQTYMQDDGGWLHPNQTGANRVAGILSGLVNSMGTI